MKYALHSSHAPAWPTIAATALALALGSGCSTQSSDGSSSTTGTFLEDLTTDLGVCGAAHDSCMQAADGDPHEFQTCKDERSACGDAVKAALKEIHDSIRACATTARACWMKAADAGPDARKACGTQLRACVEEALPPPPPLPPCAAALKQCLSSTGDGGVDARKACLQTFHTCVDATLPPCMHALDACIEDRTEPRFACERQAEACRHYRATHDGGLPPPAPSGSSAPAPSGSGRPPFGGPPPIGSGHGPAPIGSGHGPAPIGSGHGPGPIGSGPPPIGSGQPPFGGRL